ncbi:hypothetical protein CEQ07_05075 [Oligella urethralis]|nr:hypothetical protein CEQ07_05075 [Oligella urethralis]
MSVFTDGFSRIELTKLIDYHMSLTNELKHINMCCTTCSNYERKFCKVFNATPPEDVINLDTGCEHWIHNGIPF